MRTGTDVSLRHGRNSDQMNLPVLGGASAVIVVFWLTVFALNTFIPLCQADAAIALKAPFKKYDAALSQLKSKSVAKPSGSHTASTTTSKCWTLWPVRNSRIELPGRQVESTVKIKCITKWILYITQYNSQRAIRYWCHGVQNKRNFEEVSKWNSQGPERTPEQSYM